MDVYHIPVSREDMREWWDPMTSLKVTWTLLHVPHTTMVKDDSCAMGSESKVNQNFRSPELEKKVNYTVNSHVLKT
jgi:hypothetical protein